MNYTGVDPKHILDTTMFPLGNPTWATIGTGRNTSVTLRRGTTFAILLTTDKNPICFACLANEVPGHGLKHGTTQCH